MSAFDSTFSSLFDNQATMQEGDKSLLMMCGELDFSLDNQAITMQQGDTPLLMMPDNFDFDWSLMQDDWGNGLLLHRTGGNSLVEQSGSGIAAGTSIATSTFSAYHEPLDLAPSMTHHEAHQHHWLPTEPGSFSDSLALGEYTGTAGLDIAKAHSVFKVERGKASTKSNSIIGTKIEKDVPRRRKPRLPCVHPGCTRTFPRRYELERHQRTVHNPDTLFYCFVRGCNRVTKPIHRPDKLCEHFRQKHQNVTHYVCIMEGCSEGSLSYVDLLSHLNTSHSATTLENPILEVRLRILGLRQTGMRDGTFRFESTHNCPLAFLGCECQLTGFSEMEVHLWDHTTLQKLNGYEAIQSMPNRKYFSCARWCYDNFTCTMCSFTTTAPNYSWKHLETHTTYERREHAVEIAELLRPWLIGQEYFYETDDVFLQLAIELQDSGIPLRFEYCNRIAEQIRIIKNTEESSTGSLTGGL